VIRWGGPLSWFFGLGLLAAVGLWALRFVDFDSILLLGLVAVSPVAIFAAGILLAATAGLRSFFGALVVVAVIGALALPGTLWPRTGCAISIDRDDSTIVVMSHNALVGNDAFFSSFVAQVRTIDPDVLLLQETPGELLSGLQVKLGDELFANVQSAGLQHIASKWPLADGWLDGSLTGGLVAATVASPAGDIRIANVHLSAPVNSERRRNQIAEFERLPVWVNEQNLDLLMGDFNAGASQKAFRDAIPGDMVDAHRAAGCGTGLTWTRSVGRGPAILSLDHALVDASISIEDFVIGDFAGSDHKAITVELSLDER